MMSNKLTYKKVFVDSQYRLPQSKSSSDFVIELKENFECPAGTKCWITEVINAYHLENNRKRVL